MTDNVSTTSGNTTTHVNHWGTGRSLTYKFLQLIQRHVTEGFDLVLVSFDRDITLDEQNVVDFVFAENSVTWLVFSSVVYACEVVERIQWNLRIYYNSLHKYK